MGVIGGIVLRLFHFRLSLKQSAQRDVFWRKDEKGNEFTREAWLREAFSKEFTFQHRSQDVFFVPISPPMNREPGLIFGWIARQRPVVERTPPSEGLEATLHQSWQAALLVLDPTHHEDGQKVLLEGRLEVGRPAALIASLASYLSNRSGDEPYSVEGFPIIQERSFARFAEKYPDTIQEITYDVVVPNMFGSPDDFSEELRQLRDQANVAHVHTTLKSDGAINTTASQLDEIATHVEKGGGKISARTKDGHAYKSDDYAVSDDVDTTGTDPGTPSFWERFVGLIDKVF